MLLQLFIEPFVGVYFLRQLLCVADDEPLKIRIDRVGLVTPKPVDFLLCQANPLTEGRMVGESVVAVVDLRGLEVRKLSELWI